MLETQIQPRLMTYMHIVDGMTVYGSDAEKLGSVQDFDVAAGYLDVRKGWLFTKDFYVPLRQIRTVDDTGVTLLLTKVDLTDERYNTQPTSAADGAAVQDENADVVKPEPPALVYGSALMGADGMHTGPVAGEGVTPDRFVTGAPKLDDPVREGQHTQTR